MTKQEHYVNKATKDIMNNWSMGAPQARRIALSAWNQRAQWHRDEIDGVERIKTVNSEIKGEVVRDWLESIPGK